MANLLDLVARAQLDDVVGAVRTVLALVVMVTALLCAPALAPWAALLAAIAIAFSAWACWASRRSLATPGAHRLERTSVAVDGALALGTYALFSGSTQAMPVTFVVLLAFELGARYGGGGFAAACAAFALALGLRVYLQLDVLAHGALRPAVLVLWLTVFVLMGCLAREFRARERERTAVLRERERICECFEDTVARLVTYFGVRAGSTCLGEIREVLEAMLNGGRVDRAELADRLAALIARARDDLGLTRREQEIAERLLANYSDAEIARELYLSQSTVRNHVHHIKHKAGVTSREELIALLRGEHRESALRETEMAASGLDRSSW